MIQLRDLCYNYADGTPALKGISLDIPKGEFLLICGPNGSGKTTLIRLLNGLLKPGSGTVRVDGLDPAKDGREVVRRVGMVFQDADSQIVGETVGEDVAFGPENLGLSPEGVKERVDFALEAVGLRHLAEKPCYRLSGGEKRRVAIAGVLAMQSQTLIFDEPFANLDYPGVVQILKHILALHEKGHTIILTTHDVEKVIAHVQRVAVLERGELKTVGPAVSVVPAISNWSMHPLSWLPGRN
ncbi:MAG: energy-coupling factor ABC transporter ATP-binding protein [Desulfobacteraceae bacterium]|nr:energy-coupling factor ABC transporter ATP-binding protein [Desulfobacteraceae bacterium]